MSRQTSVRMRAKRAKRAVGLVRRALAGVMGLAPAETFEDAATAFEALERVERELEAILRDEETT